MSRSIVFVLHGIGEYSDTWLDNKSSAVTALKKGAENCEFFKNRSLDSFTEFVPILYDDIFDKVIDHWSDLASGLNSAVPVMPSAPGKVLEHVEAINQDQWWKRTGLDVVLYWGFRLFQQRITLRVLNQITGKIADSIDSAAPTTSFHVLAHSLGTAVAHDALHHLGTEQWLQSVPVENLDSEGSEEVVKEQKRLNENLSWLKGHYGHRNPFAPDVFVFKSVTMLSNVSGLIYHAENPYRSIVRPTTSQTSDACCFSYLNINHKYDPISHAGSFKMPKSWKLNGDGIDVWLNHVIDDPRNIHDASHYTSHPDVYLRLLQHYVEPFFANDADLNLITSFKRRHDLKRDDSALKNKLEDISEGKEGTHRQLISLISSLAGGL